jgi:hypothetical protein
MYIGHDDKRQITAGIGAAWNGEKMNPQLIFQGKTKRSLPKTKNGILLV